MKSSKALSKIAVIVLFCVGIITVVSCIKAPPKPPHSLDGKWRTYGHSDKSRSFIELSICDDYATLIEVRPNTNVWREAILEGHLSLGDTCIRNIVQLSEYKYSCDFLYPSRNYASGYPKIIGLEWHRSLIEIHHDYIRFDVDFSVDTLPVTPDISGFMRLLEN